MTVYFRGGPLAGYYQLKTEHEGMDDFQLKLSIEGQLFDEVLGTYSRVRSMDSGTKQYEWRQAV